MTSYSAKDCKERKLPRLKSPRGKARLKFIRNLTKKMHSKNHIVLERCRPDKAQPSKRGALTLYALGVTRPTLTTVITITNCQKHQESTRSMSSTIILPLKLKGQTTLIQVLVVSTNLKDLKIFISINNYLTKSINKEKSQKVIPTNHLAPSITS